MIEALSRPGRAALVAMFVVSIMGLVSQPTTAAAKSYSGTVIGDPVATVAFDVRTNKKGDPKTADFQFANVQMFYEDGTVARDSLVPVLFRFKNSQTFHQEMSGASFSGSSFYEVKGHLLSRGRARGYLVYVGNAYNPPPAGVPPRPDRSTHGRVYWTAKRLP